VTMWRDNCIATASVVTNCIVPLNSAVCYACNVGFYSGTNGLCTADVTSGTVFSNCLIAWSTTVCLVCRPPFIMLGTICGYAVQFNSATITSAL
jgi:hypothetical protein